MQMKENGILGKLYRFSEGVVYNCKVMDTAFGLNKVCDLVE